MAGYRKFIYFATLFFIDLYQQREYNKLDIMDNNAPVYPFCVAAHFKGVFGAMFPGLIPGHNNVIDGYLFSCFWGRGSPEF